MYEQIPQLINPVAFSLGSFAVRWYALAWIASFGTVWAVLLWRLRRGENTFLKGLDSDVLGDIVTYALVGAVLGGRLGYAIFYDLTYFLAYPLTIIWPFVDGVFVGISGMSFHGGVIGVATALWILAHKKGWPLLQLMDFIVPAIPLGYMFGRIGNFLNHELWGRMTESPIGMYFVGAPDGGTILRHPSQIYEAIFEGAILFVVLWCLRNHYTQKRGLLTGLFLVGYSLMRFIVELFRAPDAHIGLLLFSFTAGQLLSIAMAILGVFIIVKVSKSHKY